MKPAYLIPLLSLLPLVSSPMRAQETPPETGAASARSLPMQPEALLRYLAEHVKPLEGENRRDDLAPNPAEEREKLLFMAELCRDARLKPEHLPLLETVLKSKCLSSDSQLQTEAVARLLVAGLEANGAEDDGSPLYAAVRAGNAKAVQLLLAAGARADGAADDEHSPLYIAVSHHHADIAELLLAAGAKPKLAPGGYTLLHVALRDPDPEDCSCCSSAPNTDDMLRVCRLLLKQGMDVKAVSEEGETLLHWVMDTRGEPLPLVRLLLEAGADVNATDAKGRTPLDIAVHEWTPEVCRALQEAGGRVARVSPVELAGLLGDADALRRLPTDTPESVRNAALAAAIEQGHWESCRVLLDAGAVLKLSRNNMVLRLRHAADGVEPVPEDIMERVLQDLDVDARLHMAIAIGNVGLCRKYIGQGANIHDPSFLVECVDRRHVELCRLLLEAGADANGATAHGYTALGVAAVFGHEDIVKLLLEAGANPNGVSVEVTHEDPLAELSPATAAALLGKGVGKKKRRAAAPSVVRVHHRPLLEALGVGNMGICDMLVAAGATLSPEDGQAFFSDERRMMSGGIKPAVVRWLLDRGVSVRGNETLVRKFAVMHSAREHSSAAEVCDMLLAAGAELGDWTPLHLAVCLNRPEKVRELLAAGAKVNAADAQGDTPLILAARSGYAEICRLLLAAGARCDQANKAGERPLGVALSELHTKAVRSLLDAGALALANRAYVAKATSHAVFLNVEELVYSLLRAGLNANTRTPSGGTFLHEAAETHYYVSPLVLRILMAYGANPKARDKRGLTPARLAQKNEGMSPTLRKVFQEIAR